MVPQPITGFIFLYNLSAAQVAASDSSSSPPPLLPPTVSPPFYMHQRIGNACGTSALLHLSVFASLSDYSLVVEGSWLEKFVFATAGKTPSQVADLLEDDTELEEMHTGAASDVANSTDKGSAEDDVNLHFVALVPAFEARTDESSGGGSDGDAASAAAAASTTASSLVGVLELDGRKGVPVLHALSSPSETFADAAMRVVKQFMDRDPQEVNFTIVALAKTEETTEE